VAHSDSVLSEKIAHSFLRDADKALGIMQGFLSMNINHPTPQDLLPFAIQAHGMKSALANIQKYILSETAKTLESAANDSDIQTIVSQAPEFIKAVQTLVKEMSPPEQTENIPDSDPNLLREQLKVIADACDSYNKKAANGALKRLRQETWSNETKTLISEIEAKLLHSEFEVVSARVHAILD
jgi:HPt (histidine-containing phosphotransfer) domain-containing protein